MQILLHKVAVSEIDSHDSDNKLSQNDEKDAKHQQLDCLAMTLFSKDGKIKRKSEPQTLRERHKSKNASKMTRHI